MSSQTTFQNALSDLQHLLGPLTEQPVTLWNGVQLLPGLGMQRAAQDIQLYRDVLERNITNIVILGEFSRGKSTLLNAILGSGQLPARATPTTAVINRIVYGIEEKITVFEHGELPRHIDREAFTREFQLTDEDIDVPENRSRFHKVEYVQIEFPHPLLENGISIFDTPGLGEHWSRTQLTMQYLRQAQVIVFVMDAQKALSQEERNLIKLMGERRINHVFFVINRVNQMEPSELHQVQQWVRTSLSDYFTDESGKFDEAFYKSRLFWLDARGALRARSQRPVDSDALSKSGLLDFEDSLNAFLNSGQRQIASIQTVVRNLIFLAAAARQRIRHFQEALSIPVEKLKQRTGAAHARLELLTQEMDSMRNLLELMTGRIKYAVYADILNYISEMQSSWEDDCARLIDLDDISVLRLYTSSSGQKELAQKLDAEFRTYLEIKFAGWSERIPTIIATQVKDIRAEIDKRARSFAQGLGEAEGLVAGRDYTTISTTEKLTSSLLQNINLDELAGSLLQESGIKNVAKLVVTGVAATVVLALVSGGWLVPAIDVGLTAYNMSQRISDKDKNALRQATTEKTNPVRTRIIQSIKDNLFARMRGDLFQKLREEIGSRRDELHAQMDKDFSILTETMLGEFQNQIDSVHADINRLEDFHDNQGSTAETELKRLELVQQEIMRALNQTIGVAYQKTIGDEELEQAAKTYALVDLLPENTAEPVIGILPEPPPLPPVKLKPQKPSTETSVRIAEQISKNITGTMGLPSQSSSTEGDPEIAKLSPDLAALVGLKTVKERILELMYFIQIEKERNKDKESKSPNLHMIFSGNPGTGKTSVARIIGKIFKHIGLLKKGDVHEVKVNDLTSRYVGDTTKEALRQFNLALDGVLFIDEAYQLVNDKVISYRSEVVDVLLTFMVDNSDRVAVIAAGYPEKMNSFLDANPGLRRRFPPENVIEFPDYTPAELMQILLNMLKQDNLSLSETAYAHLNEVTEGLYATRKHGFGNAGEMGNLLDSLKRKRANRVKRAKLPDSAPIEPVDISPHYEKFTFSPASQPDEILRSLDKYVGMKAIKDEISLWVDEFKYQQRFNKDKKISNSMHILFRGNPGTGKTSIAHEMGRILKSLGILRSDTVKVVTSSDLIGEYRGNSGPKTKKVIDDALGGILFIDEAYTLTTGNRTEQDFAAEVIKELIIAMESYRDQLVVIFAGYPEKMDRFLDSNEGLASRISRKFNFPDNTPSELMEIFRRMLTEDDLILSEAGEVKINLYIQSMYRYRDSKFGNGRDVRNLFDTVNRNRKSRVLRLPDSPDLNITEKIIEPQDIPEYIRPKVKTVIEVPLEATIEDETPETQKYIIINKDSEPPLDLPHPATDRSR